MNALTVAVFEFRRRIRSKWFLIGTFGMPLLILALSLGSGYLLGSDTGLETKYVMCIDETSVYGELLKESIEHKYEENVTAPLEIAVTPGRYEHINQQFESMVEENAITGFIVIPEDFESSAALRIYGFSGSNIRTSEIIERALKDILLDKRADAQQLDASTKELLFFDIETSYYAVGETEEKDNTELMAEYMAPFLFMFLLTMGIFTGGQLLLRAVLEERSSRVIEVLLSTLSYRELMTGKILGLGMLGITQSVIYLIVITLTGNHFGIQLVDGVLVVLFLLYFILGYLFYASIYIGAGALFDSEQEAQQAIQIITFIAIIPMMLWTLVIENPNSTLVNVLSYFPPVTPFFMILKVALGETNAMQIASTLLVMTGSVIATIWAAAKVFRTGILLYGKRITLPEIWRWLRA